MSQRKTRLRKLGEADAASEAVEAEAPAVEAAPVAPAPKKERARFEEEGLLAIAGMDLGELARLMDGGTARLKTGEKVKGRVTRVSREYAFVDVGQKAEATLDTRDLGGAGVGDMVEAFVMDVGDDYVRLSRTLRGNTAAAFLAEAESTGLPVEGEVKGTNPGGLIVKIGSVRGFCPASQAGPRGVNLESLVGRTLQFQVTDASGNEPVLSRRALMEADIAVREEAFYANVEPGQRFTGVVVSTQDFGAFVDIDGVQGLVHRSELSYDRQLSPSQVVTVGQELEVVVLDVDRVARKLSLSSKDAAGSPWTKVGTEFLVGGVYDGKVTGTAEFGVFVQISPGLQGLLHKSRNPGASLRSGQDVKVRLDGIDVERKRLELSHPDHEGGATAAVAPSVPRGQGGNFGTFGDLLGGLNLKKSE
ncbi:MAG: S1 RNA-binding domain-containing protein [Proteobacteria bacterium]|nr:S1 RNA-binding domain-containing protein [Pseudomonadota bacterium]